MRLFNVSERDAHPWMLKLSNEYRSRDPATASTTFTVQVQTVADPIVDPGNINKNASRVNVLAVAGPAAGGIALVFFVVVTVVVFKGRGGLRPGLRRFWQKVFGDGDHIYTEITDFQGFRESTNLKQLLSDDPAIPLLSTPTFVPRSSLDNASPTRDAGVQTLPNPAHLATPTDDGPIKTTQNQLIGFISVSTQTKPSILKKPNPRRAKPASGSAPDSEYENLIGSESALAPPTDPLNSQSDSSKRQGNKPKKTSRRRRVLNNQSFPSMSGSSDQSNPPDSSVQSGANACRGNIQSNEQDDQYEIPVDNVNPKKDQDCQEGYMYMKYP